MNFLESFIPAHLATALGETLMHSLWELTAVAIVLLLGLQLVHKQAARLRYGLSLAALVAMVALPIATFVQVYQAPGPETVAVAATATPETVFLSPVNGIAPATTSVLAQVSAFFQEHASAIVLLWLAGALLFTVRLGRNYLKVQQLRRDNTLPVPEQVLELLCELRDRMGVRQAVRFLQSTAIDSPMVIGALRPVVLVPAGLLTGMDPQQIECIMAHELAHIRRYDYLVNLFQSVAEVALFFHPAVWWVSHLMREERENCCDQVVVDLKADRLVYARALLNLEVLRNRQPELAMSSTGGKLLKRIHRITGKPEGDRKAYSRGIFVGVLSLLACLALLSTGNRDTKASSPEYALLPPVLQYDADHNQFPVDDGFVEADDSEFPDTEVVVRTVALNAGDDPARVLVVKVIQMAVDSPFTKVTLQEGNSEVTVFLDDNGDVVAVNKDGKNLPATEFDRYEALVRSTMGKLMYANNPPPPPPPFPGAAPKGNFPAMPVPPAPRMHGNDMPVPPVPPTIKGDFPQPPAREKGESDRAYEKRMEAYEEEVEAWAERFEAEFEKGDWEKFERDMEVWAEKFEREFEGQDWKKFEHDMERWAEGFSAQFQEQDWEEFGARMEAWGEEFGSQWEEWGERFGKEWEEWGEKFGEEMADKFDGQFDDFPGPPDAPRSDYHNGISKLHRTLEADDLVERGKGFRLKINEDEMYVNGERQSRSTRDRYAELLDAELGLDADTEDFIQINRKKGSLEIQR